MYATLKSDYLAARKAQDKVTSADLLGVIDAVDKRVMVDKKKAEAAGKVYHVQDSDVTAIIKNQAKNILKSIMDMSAKFGPSLQTDSMQDTVTRIESYLPAKLCGDELRLVLQDLGATSLGQAMGLLKKRSTAENFDFDGKEASSIARDIFI